MALGEFELIRRFFKRPLQRQDSALGVGDDCALLRPGAGDVLAVTVDTLVEGVHFLPDVDAAALGHKALAVNLSDLAAMGAEPRWVTLAMSLPRVDESWLERFADGFMALAGRHHVDLVGGDTTRGPLTITVQAIGSVDEGRALRRSSARVGDLVYVTGDLGLAGLGLAIRLGRSRIECSEAIERLERPQPRVAAGVAIAGLASACIDVSDGLAGDLGHILEASGVGATLDWNALPLADAVRSHVDLTGDWAMPLTAGDDYELCFTVAPDREAELQGRLRHVGCRASRIGRIDRQPGLRLRRGDAIVELRAAGYVHFDPASEP